MCGSKCLLLGEKLGVGGFLLLVCHCAGDGVTATVFFCLSYIFPSHSISFWISHRGNYSFIFGASMGGEKFRKLLVKFLPTNFVFKHQGYVD